MRCAFLQAEGLQVHSPAQRAGNGDAQIPSCARLERGDRFGAFRSNRAPMDARAHDSSRWPGRLSCRPSACGAARPGAFAHPPHRGVDTRRCSHGPMGRLLERLVEALLHRGDGIRDVVTALRAVTWRNGHTAMKKRLVKALLHFGVRMWQRLYEPLGFLSFPSRRASNSGAWSWRGAISMGASGAISSSVPADCSS